MKIDDSFCEIYFVRHGETDWNYQNRIQGQTDIPLNQNGFLQAEGLREKLSAVPFSAAFSSDLSRARQTAELVLQPRSIEVTVSEALRERHAGALEGLDKKSFEDKFLPFFQSSEALNQKSYLQSAWHPEIETMHSVFHRVIDFLYPYVKKSSRNQPILVVSHGGVLRSLLDHVSFHPNKRWIVDNCGFIKIKMNSKKRLELLDCHLISQQHWV